MSKYLELFLGEVGDLTEKTKLENKPYVCYSTKLGKVTYTVVPVKEPVVEGPADNEIWYTTVDETVAVFNPQDSEDNEPYNMVISNTYENDKGIIKLREPLTYFAGDNNFGTPWYNGGYTGQNDYLTHGKKITSIILPEGLQTIGGFAFGGLSNNTEVVIPASVNKFKPNSFSSNIIYKFNGTTTQWEAIEKEFGYNMLVWSSITVQCTDGDIIIPAA